MNTQLDGLASNAATLLGLAATAAGLRCILQPGRFATSFGLPGNTGYDGACSCSLTQYDLDYSDHTQPQPLAETSGPGLGFGAQQCEMETKNVALPSLADSVPGPASGRRKPRDEVNPKTKDNPFIPLVGARTVAAGLCLLAFSFRQDRRATGVILLCNVVSMLGDVVVCYREGTAGSTRSHLVASFVFTVLGGYMVSQP